MLSLCWLFSIVTAALLACSNALVSNISFGRTDTQRHGFGERRKVLSSSELNSFSSAGMWNNGLSYGKGTFRFYKSFEDWMSVFPQEDREAFPEIFNFPEGVYEVRMNKPLGIVFEEVEPGKGVYVAGLVEGGQAGDVLLAITAVKVAGAKWERRLIPALKFDFETVVGAIGSNDRKWGCDDVVLLFRRYQQGDDEKVQSFLNFFEPPYDSMWKQR
jgi:hypothetical protein